MTAVRRRAGLWVLSLVIIAVAAFVVTASSPALAAPVRPAASAAPVQMNYACTSKVTGLVRYVSSPTGCNKAENAVTIVPGPVYLCIYFNFAVRQVAAASDCPSSTFRKEVTLPPTSGPVYFCALKLGGLLTYVTDPSKCSTALQFPVVVPVPHTVSVTNPGNQTSTVGSAVSLQIQASDSASGQTLAYSAAGLPAGLSISSSTGLISGTPTTAGTSSVTVTATDTTGAHGSASFTWTVNAPANTVSVTNPGNQTSTVGSAVSLQIQASDSASGQTLAYSAAGLPAGLSISSSTGLISGTPTTAGTSSVTVTATDTTGAHGSASFTWTVNAPANTVSVTNPGNQTSTVGSAVSLQIQASDSASGQTLAYSAAGLPAGLSISSSTGLISGTPTTAGTSSVTVTATDTTGAHGSASFTWTVNAAAQPPTANPQSYTAVGNTTLAVGTTVTGPAATVPASGGLLQGDTGDASCGPLTVTGHTAPAHGTIVTLNTDGTFTYLPAAGFTGTDTFNYTITCGTSGQTASNTVTITVGTLVWYVNNTAAAGGNGESSAPFNTLASAGSTAGANSIIFLYQGSGSYAGGLIMKSGQSLFGQPHGLTVSGNTLVAAGGSNPVITNSGGDGIDLASGVDVEHVTVDGGSGASATGINGSGITGTVTIANSTVTGSGDNNAVITDASGSLNLVVAGSTFSNGGSNSSAGQGFGLNVNVNGSTSATISVTGSTFTSNADTDFYVTTDSAASGTDSVTFSNNQVNGGGGAELNMGGTSKTTITMDGNNIQGVGGNNGIGIDDGAANANGATLTGTINGNTIGTPGVSDSGGGNSIGIFAEGSGTETLAITNNHLSEYFNLAGIYYIDREGSPAMNLTITGNTLTDPSGNATLGGAWGIYGDAGAQTSDTGAVCAGISGNSVTGAGQTSLGSPDIEVDQTGSATYRLPGYTGGSTDTNAVATFIAGNNGDTASNVLATVNGGGFSGGAACPAP